MAGNKIICILTTSDISYQQPLIRAATSLQQSGYSVKMIGRKLPSSIPILNLPFRHKRLSCFFHKKALFYVEYNIRLFFYLLFTRQHAICAVDLDTILPALYISHIKRIPRIYDARELFTEMKSVITRPAIQKCWLKIERYSVPHFKWGYAVSQGIANELNRRYGVDYRVIRNIPVLRDAVEPDPPYNRPYLLYQGYVHEARGIENLIKAMPAISMPLVICGTGNVYKECVALAAQLHLNDKVIFKGQLPPDQLYSYTKNAYIGLNLVERAGLNQYYSLANKFFDYIQGGIPQITMNFPEYKRINKESEVALLIDDIESTTIAVAIKQLINDRLLYQRLQSNCMKARIVLNWQEEEKHLIQFYQQILS